MKDLLENLMIPLMRKGKCDVIDIFEKFKTDQDRIIYVLNIMWEIDFIPDATNTLKNAKESKKLRKEGDRIFRDFRGNYNALCYTALKLYTKSIAFAPGTSRQLILTYANRSAVLFDLGLYSECIQDIDRALNLNYPDDLKGKLYLRKTECLFILGDHTAKNSIKKAAYWINKMTPGFDKFTLHIALEELRQKIEQEYIQDNPVKLEKSESDPPLPVIRSYNKEVPCASDAVALTYDKRNGRHVVATRNIEAGEVLVVEKPYSLLLKQQNILSHCSNCLRVCFATIPCKYCTHNMYCSEQCRYIEWKKCHDVECAVFSIMVNHEFGDNDFLSLRLAILAVKEAGNIQKLRAILGEVDKSDDPRTMGFLSDGKFHSNKYISLYSLERNTEKRSFLDLFNKAVDTCFILYLLAKYTTFFGAKLSGNLKVLATNKNVTFLGGLILRNQQIVPTNAHRFCEVQNLKIVDHGLALTAFCSLFNHSCDANVIISSRPQDIVSYAKYPIKKGEQLLCEYGVNFASAPKLLRQQHLLKQYFFSCNCVPCLENWPVTEDCKSILDLVKGTRDVTIIASAFFKFSRWLDIINVGDVLDKPYIVEDLLEFIRVLHDRGPIACRELIAAVGTLKRVYEYHANKYDMPTIQRGWKVTRYF